MDDFLKTEITPDIRRLAEKCRNHNIDPTLYSKYDVKRGLRDSQGVGVLTGLTAISEVTWNKTDSEGRSILDSEGHVIEDNGHLYYREVEINDFVNGFLSDCRFGFEEATYMLLFGELPNKEELENFNAMLAEHRQLPMTFVRDVIMKAPSNNLMNSLQRSVLTMYSYDDNPDDISIENVLRQSIQLIAQLPMLAAYSYRSYRHFIQGRSLYIHNPKPNLSTAENILRMLRSDKKYTELEAKVLDMALVLHAEHGGGNNSTFTTRVVTSSGTDTYSAIAAALGSLKGPLHGGANLKVVQMFDDIKKHVSNWENEDEVAAYLAKILDKKAFDNKGLIYGMGHAVYSVSDPRAEIFKKQVQELSENKGCQAEFRLMDMVERLAKQMIMDRRTSNKAVSANVDFYSGFAYRMLNLPTELYTPIFATARVVGWSAHRIEELAGQSKIIRPAYRSVAPRREYASLKDRGNN
ncbi:MAG: citrate/2-methylcitrate synthase [Clostridia bacterium]|nr:citrate/2-methylcitrate synthase [Clostridia bacterium]